MTRWTRIAAVAPVVGVSQFVATWVTLAIVVEEHDPLHDAISELAALGAPHRPVMTGSLILFGLLVAPLGPLLWRALAPFGMPAAVLVGTNAVGTVAVGLVPCSPGCPGSAASVLDLGHLIAAIVSYAGLAGAPLATSWALRRADARPGLATTSLALGSVTAVGLLVLLSGVAGEWGGAVQRASTTTGDLWYVIAAWSVLGTRGRLTRA